MTQTFQTTGDVFHAFSLLLNLEIACAVESHLNSAFASKLFSPLDRFVIPVGFSHRCSGAIPLP